MLKSLDILIGLAVVMLALSMAVTIITQFVTTTLNTRGAHLRRGIVDLLGQLDPELKKTVEGKAESAAKAIATAVLTHPLVSASTRRLGSVIHREELTKLLMDLATDDATLPDTVKKTLRAALARQGISDPAATLKNVRELTQHLEAAHPSVAEHVRQATALLQEARSDLTGKINAWFDQTMDRVSQRFTASTRAITFASGFVVAAVLQVDTVALVNRLSSDEALRSQYTQAALNRSNPQPGQPDANNQQASIDREGARYRELVTETGLIAFPKDWPTWLGGWKNFKTIVGVLLTSLLLSLGAPFWYNTLGQLVQLRSAIAKKDDQQRESRQSTTAAVVTTAGERGDLVAIG